jgi:hypothetical protein
MSNDYRPRFNCNSSISSSPHQFLFVLLCWVGEHCGIYKSSWNVSYLNLPPLLLSFIPLPSFLCNTRVKCLGRMLHHLYPQAAGNFDRSVGYNGICMLELPLVKGFYHSVLLTMVWPVLAAWVTWDYNGFFKPQFHTFLKDLSPHLPTVLEDSWFSAYHRLIMLSSHIYRVCFYHIP